MIVGLSVLVLFYIGMAYYIWFVEDTLYRNERYQALKRKLRKKTRRIKG